MIGIVTSIKEIDHSNNVFDDYEKEVSRMRYGIIYIDFYNPDKDSFYINYRYSYETNDLSDDFLPDIHDFVELDERYISDNGNIREISPLKTIEPENAISLINYLYEKRKKHLKLENEGWFAHYDHFLTFFIEKLQNQLAAEKRADFQKIIASEIWQKVTNELQVILEKPKSL